MLRKVYRGAVAALVAGCLILNDARVFGQVPVVTPKLPILESTTYVLIRLDLTKVDGDALVTWITETADKAVADPGLKQQNLPPMRSSLQQLAAMQKALIKAGAPVIYFAFNEFPAPSGPLIYAPVAGSGNRQAIRALLYSGVNGAQKGPDVANAQPTESVSVSMPDGVFVGTAAAYQRIKDSHAESPQLLRSVVAAPDAPLQLAAAPTPALGALLEAMLPQLPPPIDAPMTTFSRGIRSAVMTVHGPPMAEAHLTIQASDPAAAQRLNGVVRAMLVRFNSPQMQQLAASSGVDLKALTNALNPKVSENRISIDLAGDGLSTMSLTLIFPQLFLARQAAMMVQSRLNLHSLALAAAQYAKENQGKLPTSLEQIKTFFDGNGDRVVSNPLAVNDRPGYIYVRWADTAAQIPKPSILFYENPAALPAETNQINVAFADGSVESIAVAKVLDMMKKAPSSGR